MAFKLFGKIKVCAQSGYNYKDVPTIMLKGLWLKECGFDFGVPVHEHMAYDKKGIYKINLSNQSDVSLINLGFTSKWEPLCDSGSCEVYMTLIGDIIVGGDFQVLANDTVIHTAGDVKLEDAATPLFRYKEFLVGWGGSYGNEYRQHYLLMPYLASINNLGSVVEKTADKTMKITYTLTEEG